jgi:hypothetical protein
MVPLQDFAASARSLWLSAVTGAALALAGCEAPRVADEAVAAGESRLSRFEFMQPQMGVPFRIVLYAPDAAAASNAVCVAFARIASLNQIMSDYEDDSEVFHARPVQVAR